MRPPPLDRWFPEFVHDVVRAEEVARLAAGVDAGSDCGPSGHEADAYEKLGVGDRAAAVGAAYERGLLPSRQR